MQWFEDRQEDSDTVWYRIGSQDEILAVSKKWDEFALENGAPHLQASYVVGRSLWSFISGAEVRHLYELLMARIRGSQRTLVLPFRCDAPDRRRYMEMAVAGMPSREVDFVTRVIREEPRESTWLETAEADPLRTSQGGAEQSLLAICSWCKKVRLSETEWVELEQAIARLALFQRETLPRVAHGVCQDCYMGLVKALAASPEILA